MESARLRISIGSTVGILGGGQLARMLAEAAHRLGLSPVCLAASPEDPAALVCPRAMYGALGDRLALERFFREIGRGGSGVVAFENEFVDCALLESAAAGAGVRFLPSLQAIHELQDKLRQKKLLERLGIASAPYEAMPAGADPRAWARSVLRERFPRGAVLKWARQGYDGKGTGIFAPGDEDAAGGFAERAAARGVPLYAEERIAFRRELALVGCRSVTGDWACWPAVVSRQEAGICRLVTGPAQALGFSRAREDELRAHARAIAETVPLAGTFAIEYFETEAGATLVNELAPRVHNSGHFTLDASRTSQFENHWRALLGLPLGRADSAPAFAMLNLLGWDGKGAGRPPLPRVPSDVSLHWYGKEGIRPGRKLGHLNAAAADGIEGLAAGLEACERAWRDEMKG